MENVTFKQLMETAEEINFTGSEDISEVDELINKYGAIDHRSNNNNKDGIICYGETTSNGKRVRYQIQWNNNVAVAEFRPMV